MPSWGGIIVITRDGQGGNEGWGCKVVAKMVVEKEGGQTGLNCSY